MFRRFALMLWLALVTACVSVPPKAPPPGSASQSFVVKDVRLFDGERVVPVTDVFVVDGKIMEIGRGLQPVNAQVINGRGMTLLPGLIDAHVHSFPGSAEDALRFGVTTELEMFGMAPPEVLAASRSRRDAYGPTTRSDVWTSGIGVTTPDGIPARNAPPGAIPSLSNDGDATAFIAERVANGSDYIKIYYDHGRTPTGEARFGTFTPEQLRRAVAAAHALRRIAVVHVGSLDEARTAVDAGADGLAHIFTDSPADPAFVSLALTRGLFVIPTFSAIAGGSASGEAAILANDPRVRPLLSASQAETLAETSRRPSSAVEIRNAVESIRRLHRAGVPILAGTDAPNPGTAHGAAMPIELAYLVSSGMSPLEALRSATSIPARLFSLGDRGVVRPGSRADLLLVRGDPTSQIGALRDIVAIWKNGRRVNRTPPTEDLTSHTQ